MQLQEVPTLRPTSEQFDDPIAYLSSPEVLQMGSKFGMLKIVAPDNFKPPLSINKSKFKFVPRLQKLHELNLVSRCRSFFYNQLRNYNTMNQLDLPKDTYEILNPDAEDDEDKIKLYYYDFFLQVISYFKDNDNSTSNKTPPLQNGIPNISNSVLSNHKEFWIYILTTYYPNTPLITIKSVYETKLAQYFNYLSSKPNFTTTSIPNTNVSVLQQSSNNNHRKTHKSSTPHTPDSNSPQIIKNKENVNSFLNESESSSEDESDDEEAAECLICHKSDEPENTLLCDSCNKPYHKQCLNPPLKRIPEGNWYCEGCILGNGQYGFKDSSFEYSLKDFEELCADFDSQFFQMRNNGRKPRSVEDLEEMFWNLVEGDDDISNNIKVNYGADIHNLQNGQVSGFPTLDYTPSNLPKPVTKEQYRNYALHSMNLNNLPFDKNSLLSYLNVDISGMTIPWIYVGSTFSTFCWHVEDQWTLSANYQHYGAIKKWYSIPSSDAAKFEEHMKQLAPDLFVKQPDILHQLITLVSPFKLVQKGIQCYTANQQPGEYIVTYPRVYHSGFNTGYNFNEAVNFTMKEWLKFGVDASLNYKQMKVSKASVFDVWELMITILKVYGDEEDDRVVKKDLLKECVEFLKGKLNDEYQLYETVKIQFENSKKIKVHSKPKGVVGSSKEEDGVICSKCKSFCTFFYVKHYTPAGKTTEVSAVKKDYLITPQPSPHSTDSSSQRRSKRIKVLQESVIYDTQVLCIEDFLKVQDQEIEMDELFVVRDIEEVKDLVKELDGKVE